MSIRVSTSLLHVTILLAAASAAAFADTIDFESQCPAGQQASGACSALFNTVGNAESLTVNTPSGSVMIQGGALFDAIANLPVDETALYGTAGNAAGIGVFPGAGFLNPITITFPKPITGFFLDVLNGNTINVDYHLADNLGNVADFILAPNLSGGQKTIGFAATGSVVTISAATGQSTPSGMTWDFLIDNINFTTAQAATPEPRSVFLIGLGLLALVMAKHRRLAPILALAGFNCGAATVSQGLTPPVLTLSDNFGDSVSIDATGAAVCTASCNTMMSGASAGSITWEGTLGLFTVSVAGGQTKPALPASQVNLGLRVSTGAVGAGGAGSYTLTAKWSDVGFSGAGSAIMTTGYATAGTVNIINKGYVDNSNALFGTGTAVGTVGPVSGSSDLTIIGPGPSGGTFSMTQVLMATMGANSSFTLSGFSLTAGPPLPLALGCPSASGQLNVPYDSYLTASGGLPPYSFSNAGGLPPGLTLNPSTGEVSGTPTMAGTFPFTPQVMDTQNLVQNPCSIVITSGSSSLALACPDPNVEEGEAYSSSLVATGGTPPYSFFITSGSLPPGLSLNPSTGSLTGTDKSTIGSFPFTAQVTGSSANAAANKAFMNCLVLAAAPTYTMIAVPGTTPQTVVVNASPAAPLAVVLTDSKTKKPVAGETVTFSVIISPKTQPSGLFAGGMNNDLGTMNSIDVVTDAKGIATAPKFTANKVLGNYSVNARLQGVPNVVFKLTNTPGAPAFIRAVAGMNQTTVVGTAFKKVLTAEVTDQFGNRVPNFPVAFAAPPAPGAGATFGAAALPTATVKTDQNGIATSPAVSANKVAGTYTILATVVQLVPGQPVPLPAQFPKMTNQPGDPAHAYRITPTNDPTYVKDVYYATVNGPFSPLMIEVTDQFDNPLSGWEVRFKASVIPGQPGGTFAGPNSNNGLFCKIKTGADGRVTADPLTANGNAGGWNVTVTVTGTNLTNTYVMQNVGKIAVPNVVGMTQAAATTAINGAKLNVGKVTMQSSNTVAKGNVISQNPAAATNVNVGSSVDVVISTGKP